MIVHEHEGWESTLMQTVLSLSPVMPSDESPTKQQQVHLFIEVPLNQTPNPHKHSFYDCFLSIGCAAKYLAIHLQMLLIWSEKPTAPQ